MAYREVALQWLFSRKVTLKPLQEGTSKWLFLEPEIKSVLKGTLKWLCSEVASKWVYKKSLFISGFSNATLKWLIEKLLYSGFSRKIT